MRRLLVAFAVALVPFAGSAETAAGVAWHKGDVDAAFAQAKRESKPLFLYWGAEWCPPCNQVKATIFNRADFIERSRLFVPVYVDGDAPNAQKLGTRFKVSGYPTMVLFRPDGTELTRLPGEVDGEHYMRALERGLSGTRPVKSLLASARAGSRLATDDWALLAFYSWETDHQALLPRNEMVPVLWQLAQGSNAAAPEASARLALKAMTLAAAMKPADASKPPIDKAAALRRLRAALVSPPIARANFAELTYTADILPPYLTDAGSPERMQLLREWDRALTRLVTSGALQRLDQLSATGARIALAQMASENGKAAVPLALQTEVRAVTMRALRESTDRYEREAVVTSSAQLLADAGLLDESDALLHAELKRSATPYYLMLGLASNARKRGDKAAALGWYEQAYARAEGPATRLQWGSSYVRALVDLAPSENERIERAARSVIGELAVKPETFHGRNRASLTRFGSKLAEWNQDGRQELAFNRLRAQMDAVCAQLPAPSEERTSCTDVLASKGPAK